MSKLLFTAFFLSVFFYAAYANMREVSFYTPVFVKQAPVIDGKLDDPCWKQAAPYTNTYEYFKPNPAAGLLQNTIKIVYNEQGMYLGIINYEKNPEKLRMTVFNRDNGGTWLDDCAEIFIDPDGQGVGHRRFTVSATGAFKDILRIDGAVTRNDWDSIGTVIKTGIHKDNWVIECFFPWEDMGKKAKAGDIWMFCHNRFAWTTGNFIGTTSSPGGNYSATGNFGYLCFAGEKTVAADVIANIFMQRIAPPWCVKINENLISNQGRGLQSEPLKQVIDKEKSKVAKLIPINNVPEKYKKEYNKLLTDFKKASETKELSVQTYRTLNSIGAEITKLQWKVKLENQFN